VRCFNQKVLDFLNDLVRTFPDDDEIRMIKSAFLVSTSQDDTEAIMRFKEHVAPFSDCIRNEDEGAFFSSGLDEGIIRKIKEHWGAMCAEDRAASWSVLQLLLALSEKYGE